jgi:hypothetical protein
MAGHGCETCALRAKYDRNPKSVIGRIWQWHAGWCPGWKAYMAALPREKRIKLAHHYRLSKYTD